MNDLLHKNDLISRIKSALPLYKPKPHTPFLWLDLVFLVLLAALETALSGSLLGPYIIIDLLTPWLAVSFIQKRASAVTLVAFVAALIQESRTSIPAGTYLCAYWILGNVIIQVRATLSWRYATPWIVTILASCGFVVIIEMAVMIFVSGLQGVTLGYTLIQMIRLGISVAFGLSLCRKWMAIDAEEPIPQ